MYLGNALQTRPRLGGTVGQQLDATARMRIVASTKCRLYNSAAMLSTEIRQSFLDYYTQRGHTLLPSASLVPVADPSLLLINSGMAPLKRYFLGQEAPPAPRTCNCQKCVRTIDIDQVGHTNRHNTFFEMLGKWSFGDYFKLQAMRYSWSG